MKPEQLKVIAEGMGYINIHVSAPYVYIDYSHNDLLTNYNPLTNNDQMVEIIEKLLDLGWTISKFEDKYLLTLEIVCNVSTQFMDKTINEAVCNAAYEYFKAVEK